LDPHRKGFLTENDFKIKFGSVKIEEQLLEKMKSVIGSTFSDPKTAFDYFACFKKDPDFAF